MSGGDASAPSFEALFGKPPAAHARAPGRVNLIGEHTDYQGGFVLPAAIPQQTTVEIRPREDDLVRITSTSLGAPQIASFRLGDEHRGGGWLDYVQGVTWSVRGSGLSLRGFEARVSSDVPLGSGLSSSAALEVSLLRALRAIFALPLDDVALAMAAHRAETDFVGAPVGVMDQMASSLADTTSALFLDTRSLAAVRVPLPPGVRLLVIDSAVPHHHATGGYKVRRAESEAAARALGVALLRDLSPADRPRIEALPEPLGRRARHIVTENARVLAAVEALRAEAHDELGRLLDASHASLRDDYEVTVPPLDRLVELARAAPGVIGARMTGGGFGGSIVALAWADAAPNLASEIARRYSAETGHPGRALVGG